MCTSRPRILLHFFLGCCFSCSWLLSESRALSTIRGLFSTTRYGMPAADLVIPRYDHRSKPSKRVILDCHCGRVRVSVPHEHIRVDPPPPPIAEKTGSTYHAVVDCHCPSCRKYHVADRATYLLVPADKVEFQQLSLPGKNDAKVDKTTTTSTQDKSIQDSSSFLSTYVDTCSQLGTVLRYQCAHCRTKLATQPQPQNDNEEDANDDPPPYGSDQYFLNLASARDDSLPKKWTKQWRAFRFPWQYANQCVWTRATAEYDDDDESSDDEGDDDERGNPFYLTGGCACGSYRYQLKYPSADSACTELQHCYCRICRRLSGGPFQTWMPVMRSRFSWVPPTNSTTRATRAESASHEPPLHRYTGHGRRHVCEHCGGVLTILYDADGEDVIWPAAGGLDDSSLPATKEDMSKHLYGVCHICCRFRQEWYALPNDGYSRIPDAS